MTLGTAAASAGTLSYSVGPRLYGGNIERWFPTSAITLGVNASLFPIGSSADYRPVYFGSSGLSASGGTIKVSHTSTTGSTAVGFSDAGTPIQVRSNSLWRVTTANGISSTGTPFSVQTEGTGLGIVGAVTDLRLTMVSAAAPGAAGVNGGTTTNPQVIRTGLSVANLSNSFYWGSINALQTPLPITLVSFAGRQVSDHISVSWITASELNSSYYSLLRSNNGKDFLEIGKVNSHGTTTEAHTYEWDDMSPLIGKNYYRLKSVDRDGSFDYSKIVAVDFSADKKSSIFPNPSNGKSVNIKIHFNPDEKYAVVILDNVGLVVGQYVFDQQEASIQFPVPLNPGIYYAKVSAAGFSQVHRFLMVD